MLCQFQIYSKVNQLYINIYLLFQILSPYMQLQSIEQSSLCYIVGPSQLSIYSSVYMSIPVSPDLLIQSLISGLNSPCLSRAATTMTDGTSTSLQQSLDNLYLYFRNWGILENRNISKNSPKRSNSKFLKKQALIVVSQKDTWVDQQLGDHRKGQNLKWNLVVLLLFQDQ